MLAQSFKTAEDLKISEEQKDALIKTLVLLETNKMKHVKNFEDLPPSYEYYSPFDRPFSHEFNMASWSSLHSCGTVACIGGTAVMVGRVSFSKRPAALENLFYPTVGFPMSQITTEQAARALRSYLTTGNARWDLAIDRTS